MIATRTGGVAEVVRDGENGLLVEPGDVDALAAAIDRFFADAELARAAARGTRRRRSRTYAPGAGLRRGSRQILAAGRAAGRDAARPLRRPDALPAAARRRASRGSGTRSRRDWTCACSAARRPARRPRRTFTLVPPSGRGRSTGRASTPSLPVRVARELRRFRPDAVVAAERRTRPPAARLARGSRAARAGDRVEVHGDWRAVDAPLRLAARGGCSRRVGDRARARRRVRRADARRARSRGFTAGARARARPSSRPASSRRTPTSSAFAGPPAPLPERAARRSSSACSSATRTSTGSPRRGALAARARARARAAPRRPRARRRTSPSGSSRELPERTRWTPRLEPRRGRRGALDAARRCSCCRRAPRACGRVVDRGVLPRPAGRRRRASAGSPTSSRTASTACSSSRATTAALADALERRAHRPRARRAARRRAPAAAPRAWLPTPEEYADRTCARSSSDVAAA